MTNYERITATPEALGAFLETLPIASGPWDVEFHRTFCKDCTAANCDGGNCPHNAQRNNPLWWLMQDGGRELPQGGPADKLGFLRDFLEGKTRWNFPEGTVFNVNTSTGDGAAVQLKPEADGEPEPPERPEPVVNLGPGASFQLENTPISETKLSPLIEAGWTEAHCRQWCEERGLLSPIYTDSTRGGCWFCPNQSIKQLRNLRKKYPEYWEIMLKWDKDSPVCFVSDKRTVWDYEERFRLEDQGLISADDKAFRWAMLVAPILPPSCSDFGPASFTEVLL